MKEFATLRGLANHLMRVAATGPEVMSYMVREAAKRVTDEAKREIGHYQQSAGAFPAWAPLADSTEAEKARLGYPTGAPLLRTGAMRESISYEVNGLEAVIGASDEVAVYHEFGTAKMPPRPVLGPALFRNRDQILKTIGLSAAAWLSGRGWKRPKIGTHHD